MWKCSIILRLFPSFPLSLAVLFPLWVKFACAYWNFWLLLCLALFYRLVSHISLRSFKCFPSSSILCFSMNGMIFFTPLSNPSPPSLSNKDRKNSKKRFLIVLTSFRDLSLLSTFNKRRFRKLPCPPLCLRLRFLPPPLLP